ncbi:hypothetical protein EDD16DRAFT_1585984 [Pisolithus croceorrhizus]|nr:hypothetical protein EDD16DRAFT_1585984 [Pisolithus croceorrhizus]
MYYLKSDKDPVSLHEVRPALRTLVHNLFAFPPDDDNGHEIDNTIIVASCCSPSTSYPSAALFTGRWTRWHTDNTARFVTPQTGPPCRTVMLSAHSRCVSPDIDTAIATASGLRPLLPRIPKLLGVVSLGNYLVDNLPDQNAMHDLSAFVQGIRKMSTIVPRYRRMNGTRYDSNVTFAIDGQRTRASVTQ